MGGDVELFGGFGGGVGEGGDFVLVVGEGEILVVCVIEEKWDVGEYGVEFDVVDDGEKGCVSEWDGRVVCDEGGGVD